MKIAAKKEIVIRPLKAIAVLKNLRPKLNLLDLYQSRDRAELSVWDDEEVWEVEITAVKRLKK